MCEYCDGKLKDMNVYTIGKDGGAYIELRSKCDDNNYLVQWVEDNHMGGGSTSLVINYCPMCGRKICN
jgi:hypothetical protein